MINALKEEVERTGGTQPCSEEKRDETLIYICILLYIALMCDKAYVAVATYSALRRINRFAFPSRLGLPNSAGAAQGRFPLFLGLKIEILSVTQIDIYVGLKIRS
jgi:hypothetical protein